MSFKKNAISGAKWTTLSKIVRSVFLLLQIVILTRYLDKSDFGLVAMCMFVVNFTNIFVDAGFTSAILFKQDVKKKELSTLYWTNLSLACVLSFFLSISSSWISNFYNEPRLGEILPLLASNVIFIALGRLHLTVMQKQLQFKKLAMIDIISVLIGLLVASTLALLNFGIYSLVFSTLIVSLTSSAIGVISNWNGNRIHFHFSFYDLRSYFKVGSYSLGGQILGFLASEIDTLIIGKILGASNLGLYDLAKNIASKFYSIISPIISKVLTPIFSLMQKSKSELKYYFTKMIRLISFFAVPIYILIFINSKELLGLLYGFEYTDGFMILSYMSVFYCINTIYNPINSLQIATGKTKLGFFWTLVCLLIYPIGIIISAKYGIHAVAFVRTLISVLLVYLMWRIQVSNMIKITFYEYISTFYKPMLIFITLGSFLLLFNSRVTSTNIFINIILNTSGGLLIYILLLLIIDNKYLIDAFLQVKKLVIKKEQ